ncbi:hypothetical protein RRG08_017901 [Elysia crispata]|uniref:Histone-lysine N-methyltransferase SETMAR n=1 Tax=Elysia crispata TaxID=231223 RepID=A0AAE1AB46_9GAST|nr:hypothetical protein RRG08_017901 [Elysia crispata]
MNGVILRWPVPIGTTINAQYYKKVLQDKLRPAIRKKRPGLLESGILFHHDNAPVLTARAVTDVLAGYKWELLEHPRYSPDLAPCDFHLFPKMKEHLRGQRFETEEDIIQATKMKIEWDGSKFQETYTYPQLEPVHTVREVQGGLMKVAMSGKGVTATEEWEKC